MKIVKSLWEEILEIMEENIKTFSIDSLDRGVRITKIEEVEDVMNIKFPSELKALYLSNNGTVGLGAILGFELISLEDMLTEWKSNKKILEAGQLDNIEFKSSEDGKVKTIGFDEKWIPFAYNNMNTYLAVDLNPGKEGTIGQVINIGDPKANSVKYVLGSSIEVLLKDTIMIYECNGLELDEEIEVIEDREDDTIELLNFLDKYLFNIKASYKGSENMYDEMDVSYNTREYDDFQEEDGYDSYREDEEEDEYSSSYEEDEY
ncbi:SMI1/KNR4 family protein [uncultured Clostridium sp.]|jgi:cell wall assembly regulator SMI1|uniref:SMI1/KNR4 family protein n=1 Tax=uncultured Clostridium sp. TaxID=59620 RepID=UPI00262D7867|nr:SMI1/KNR4 family protein [uncultured Clostridium sp.]